MATLDWTKLCALTVNEHRQTMMVNRLVQAKGFRVVVLERALKLMRTWARLGEGGIGGSVLEVSSGIVVS